MTSRAPKSARSIRSAPKGAIVSTGKARAEIPLSSFGKNDKGLVVSMTKAELDAQAKAETKTKTKTKTKTETKTEKSN